MNGIEKNIGIPCPFGAEVRVSYKEAADLIERHPNFQVRKDKNVSGNMTLSQYVNYCRERSRENYTNETTEDAQRLFEQFWKLLES
ncbi:MAG: hypothetical protein HY433_00205 [Candidatus Liptonbacteria bacterium]|nr:hypothetical protein [Candidatus Liptonbacteria bacterium]